MADLNDDDDAGNDESAWPHDEERVTAVARETVTIPAGEFVVLTNEVTTPFGIGHPENSGGCRIALNGLDQFGGPLPGGQAVELILAPGESATHYAAPAGAVAIAVGAFADCGPDGAQLAYDTPVV